MRQQESVNPQWIYNQRGVRRYGAVGDSYHPCRQCDEGKAAREGRLNDDDIEAIKASMDHGHGHGKENYMEEAKEMRLCSRHGRGCPVDGPQPIENFYRDRNSKKGRKNYCKSCQRIYDQARKDLKKSERTGNLAGIPVMPARNDNEQRQALPHAKETAPAHLLMLDFSRYPNILEMVKRQAEEDIRSPENQVLWILKQMEASWRMN
jgi:hypothetical protein